MKLIYHLIGCLILQSFSHVLCKKTFTYDEEFDLKPISVRRQMVWRALINWHDPRSWQPVHRVPCSRDRVALPEDYILFLNHQLDVTELVLPQNGELILGPEGNIRLMSSEDEDSEHSCPSGVSGINMEFHPFRDGLTSWFTPAHWQLVFQTPQPDDYLTLSQLSWSIISSSPISNYATFISTSKLANSIVPHSERIPCTGDWVHFPTNNGSFKVTIERSSQVPSLGALSIGATRFESGTQFGEFAKSFRGEMLFKIGDYNHLTILGPGQNFAQSPSLGACGNDSPKKIGTICMDTWHTCASSLPCSDPILPEGHCCQICASALVVRNLRPEVLSDRALYQSLYGHMRQIHQRGLQRVRLYGHWLYDGRFQVIVGYLDPAQASDVTMPPTDQYIQELKRLINANALLINRVDLQIRSSVEWITDSHLLGSVVWFFFILFLVSLALVPMYAYYQRNRLDPAFTFVRFRSATSDIELEVDPAGSHHRNGQMASTYSPADNLPGPASLFKSGITSIGSVHGPSPKSILTSSGGSTDSTLTSGSLFPIVPLSISAAAPRQVEAEEDKVTSEHFDNPIFRKYSEQLQQTANCNVEPSNES